MKLLQVFKIQHDRDREDFFKIQHDRDREDLKKSSKSSKRKKS